MSLKYQYENIESNIEDGRMHPLSVETPLRKPTVEKSGTNRIFKVVAFGLLLSGAMFVMNFSPSTEMLGAEAPDTTADNATTDIATGTIVDVPVGTTDTATDTAADITTDTASDADTATDTAADTTTDTATDADTAVDTAADTATDTATDTDTATEAATGGFCCHFAPDKSDMCGTCLARQTTGKCSADKASCTSCGATFCDASDPAVLATPEPGICCHYATDAADICGSCLAPDDSSCGASPAACTACGGGKNTGWCPAATAPSANQVEADPNVKAAADTATTDATQAADTVSSDVKTAQDDVKSAEDTVSGDATQAADTATTDVKASEDTPTSV